MAKRFLAGLMAGLGLSGMVLAQGYFAIGSSEILPPSGWQLASSIKDRLVFRSPDGHQQATLSVLQVAPAATFGDFTRLCAHRVAAERKELGDGFMEPENPVPTKEGDIYTLFYSGGERKTGRIFSAYFSMSRGEVITVYVEGIGVPPRDHLQSFKSFVNGLKRK